MAVAAVEFGARVRKIRERGLPDILARRPPTATLRPGTALFRSVRHGGLGTRLRSVVSDVPKPMAPVGGRPFLRFVLDNLAARGVDRVVLAVGYMRGRIMEYFGDFYRGARLVYSVEEEPLLTGGAVRKALELCRDEAVFVVNGDTLLDADFEAMERLRAERGASLVMAVRRVGDAGRFGTVCVNAQGRIESFAEKGARREGLVNGGICLMNRRWLSDMPEGAFSLERDVFEPRVKRADMYALECRGLFMDMGVPEDYARACRELSQESFSRRAVFFDRDGTINVDVGHAFRPEQLRFVEGMPEFLARWNEWGYRVIVATNQSGIARGLYSEDDMRALHREMNRRLKAFGSHVDAFYHCPHHPDFTGPCVCRKPAPGMLKKALADFELDPAECLLFGDSSEDMAAAAACGIMGVRVPSARA